MKVNEKVKQAAYHEAGRAVVAHLLGADIEKVTIEASPINHSLGYVLHKKENLKRWEDMTPSEIQEQTIDSIASTIYLIASRIMFSIAGILAEHVYRGGEGEVEFHPGANGDLEFMALMDVSKITESQQALLTKKLKQLTLDFLRTNWGSVKAIAKALIERGTINGEEATKIIDEAKSKMKGQS